MESIEPVGCLMFVFNAEDLIVISELPNSCYCIRTEYGDINHITALGFIGNYILEQKVSMVDVLQL